MDCNQADKLIMKYMDGVLSIEEANKLNLHIAECDSCREGFFAYQMMMEELQDNILEAPDGFETKVMERIKDIDLDYKIKETMPIENITAMIWGTFSLLFGIGVLLFIYRQPVLEYLLQNPYTGDWAQAMVPTVDILSAYINDVKNKFEDILSNGNQIITSLRMVLVPALAVLGSIQYYIYRKKKVEI